MTQSKPIIETERLVLRNWRESDLNGLSAIFSDEEHAKFVGGKLDKWAVWRTIALYEGHQKLRGYTLFAIEDKSSGEFLGWAGPWFPEGWPEKEIGYALTPSATGKGIAKEAVIACILYAYDKLGWNTAVSNIDPENKASQAVAQKIGAAPEGELIDLCGYTIRLWRHLAPKEFREQFA